MVIRSFVAASCVLVALAAPAGASVADDCTTELRDYISDSLFSEGEPSNPYPIVERDSQTGSIHVHPQNVVPYATQTAGAAVGLTTAYGGAVLRWVDCID